MVSYNVLRLKNVAKMHHQAFTNIHKTLYKTTVPLQKIPKPAIFLNRCVCPAYAGHTPKAFQIVQKYKFLLMNQVFGVLFFQRVQVPYERIENPNR